MKILIFDTETTGLVRDWNNAGNASNPRLVQIGLMLCDDSTGRVLSTYSSIIRPNSWLIPTEVSKIHGITNELAFDCGVNILEALDNFQDMSERADLLVAHNIKFDKVIVKGEYERTFRTWKTLPEYCTMLNSTSVCQLKGKRGIKWPKLSEAYKHFFSEELIGAHDALTDVMGCKRVYFALTKKGVSTDTGSVFEPTSVEKQGQQGQSTVTTTPSMNVTMDDNTKKMLSRCNDLLKESAGASQ